MNKFSALLFLFLGLQVFSCENLLDTDVKILNQKEYKNLCEYSDHTILVVNTASKCGFTYQYEQLETLQRRFKDRRTQGTDVDGISGPMALLAYATRCDDDDLLDERPLRLAMRVAARP